MVTETVWHLHLHVAALILRPASHSHPTHSSRIVTFVVSGTFIFTVFLETPPSLVLLVGLVCGEYNALNGICIGSWADSGALNRACGCFSNVSRRWPWVLIGIVHVFLCNIVFLVVPGLVPGIRGTSAACLYAVVYLLMSNGLTATIQSLLAVVQESYANPQEKITAFMSIGVGYVTALLFGIVFAAPFLVNDATMSRGDYSSFAVLGLVYALISLTSLEVLPAVNKTPSCKIKDDSPKPVMSMVTAFRESCCRGAASIVFI